MKKKIVLAGTAVLLLFVLSGCQQADAVGKSSITSFDGELQAAPNQTLQSRPCH